MAIEIRKPLRQFVDISLSFSPHPLTGDLPVLRDTRAINASLRNCVMTGLREKPFLRDFGSQVSSFLFDMFDDDSGSLIEDAIRRSIVNGEPRCEIDEVNVEPRLEENNMKIEVIYTLVGHDEVFTFSTLLYPSR